METTNNNVIVRHQFEKIGKYELVGEIASGGMGVVYQAYDPFMDRFVALKLPKIHASDASSDYERLFYNETNAASHLHHPNIISIYDAGVVEDFHYIAMEYIPGGVTLKRYCYPDNLLPLDLAAQLLFEAAEAMDYAHRKGVMHRDLKPSNIMLKDDREVKVSDFGLAMLSDPDLVDTQSIVLMGSPKYMAPERLNEEALTHRSDIYSLGVVMYELLTGRPPYYAESIAALTRQILEGKAPPPTEYRYNLPQTVSDVVMKAMAKDPEKRYQTMMEFAEALSKCFKDLQVPVDSGAVELRTERIKHLSFFKEFTDTDLWELLRWSDWLEAKDGEVIIKEGDMDNDVYLLVDGSVAVVKAGKEIAELRHGELFGEIAYLAERKRTATVLAKGDCTLLRLHVRQIEQASKTCQIQFQRMFISTLLDRLVRTTELLSKHSPANR